MRVILKQNVENLGSKGDIVNVAPGYGRNYLIPKKIALEVTSSNVKMIEIEQQALKKAAEKERASYQGVIEKLNETTLIFKRKAGEKDVIFGSVSSGDVKEALHERGFEIDKKKILLDEPIKRLGNFTVPIKIYHEDRAEVKVEVVTEEGEALAEKGEKAVEETPEEEEVKAAPEEEQTEDTVETQEEKEVGTKKAKKKKKAKEADAVPDREEEEAKVEEKEEKEEIFGEKDERTEAKEGAEEVKEEEAKKQDKAAEARTEEIKEEPPTAEGKKGKAKKEKKKKKKEK